MTVRRLLALAVLLLSGALASVALAATQGGITPMAPKKGATVAVGSQPVFRGTFTGDGQVWVRVSKSRKANQFGVIKPNRDTMQQRAKLKGGRFRVKARFFNYPEFWLNRPGTWYWQAHRIPATCSGPDCLVEGPITRFKVG